MDRKTNLRNATVGPDSGNKQTFTQESHQTAAWKSKNETKEYTTPNCPKGGGNMGGKNSGS